MKDFILSIIDKNQLTKSFWQGRFVQIVIRPPVPKHLIVKRHGDTITVTEAHISWFDFRKHDGDTKIQFKIDESGEWTPQYLKAAFERPRKSYHNDAGAISYKPIVTKRQMSFAALLGAGLANSKHALRSC